MAHRSTLTRRRPIAAKHLNMKNRPLTDPVFQVSPSSFTAAPIDSARGSVAHAERSRAGICLFTWTWTAKVSVAAHTIRSAAVARCLTWSITRSVDLKCGIVKSRMCSNPGRPKCARCQQCPYSREALLLDKQVSPTAESCVPTTTHKAHYLLLLLVWPSGLHLWEKLYLVWTEIWYLHNQQWFVLRT